MLSPCILHLLVQFILLIRLLTILEESVIVLRRFRMHSDNIVSLLHGIVQSSPLIRVLPSLEHLAAKGNSLNGSVVKSAKGGFRRPIGCF